MILFDKEQIRSSSPGKWQEDAFQHFESKMVDTTHNFPCIPATVGFKLDHFRYGFISDPRSDLAAEELTELLGMFGEQSHTFGKYTSLIAFFHTPDDLKKHFHLKKQPYT